MFGQHHSLTQKTPTGKIVFGLTLPQLIVVLIGARLSYDLSKIIPALPFPNFVFAHFHHAIPLFLSFFFLMAKERKTGLPVATYFYYWLQFKLRRKEYIWKR